MKEVRRQQRRAVAGLAVVAVGMVALFGTMAVEGEGIDRAIAVVLLLIMILGGVALALLLTKPRPAAWQPNDLLRLRARAGFEGPMRAVLVLTVVLGALMARSLASALDAEPVSATGIGARGVVLLGSLTAVPGLVRMLCGRLPWTRLELGQRLVYRGWWRSADVAWSDIDAIAPHPKAAHDIVIRYGRGEELLLHASLFPGARGQLLAELRRRRALAGRR